MSTILQHIEAHLKSGQLAERLVQLFCQTLRWGVPRGLMPRTLEVDLPVSKTLTIYPVAQLSGLPVLRVDWHDDRLPGITMLGLIFFPVL